MLFDGHKLDDYRKEGFYKQVGFVFQDSIIFNMSMRENIAFSEEVSDEMQKAIETAELQGFVNSLPEKLETLIYRNGGPVFRVDRSNVLCWHAHWPLNPQILFLDDFTARVDKVTERKILWNMLNNYPGLTLVTVTQKINSIEQFDQIILLMEGEIIASGTHKELKKPVLNTFKYITHSEAPVIMNYNLNKNTDDNKQKQSERCYV